MRTVYSSEFFVVHKRQLHHAHVNAPKIALGFSPSDKWSGLPILCALRACRVVPGLPPIRCRARRCPPFMGVRPKSLGFWIVDRFSGVLPFRLEAYSVPGFLTSGVKCFHTCFHSTGENVVFGGRFGQKGRNEKTPEPRFKRISRVFGTPFRIRT